MNARDHALIEIDRRKLPGWPSGLVRRRGPTEMTDPRDRALAEQLLIGVVKNLLHLRHLLRHHSGHNLSQIDPLVAKIVVLGLYQLRFMTKIPASAAVDQAVEQARRFDRARAAGFVNAVLRNATRNADPDPPDPHLDPQGHAVTMLSHPPELFQRLAQQVGVRDALKLCRAHNAEPPTLARLLRGVTPEQLRSASPDVAIRAHEQPGIVVVEGARREDFARWAGESLAQVQDATSAAVVGYLDVRPGMAVLDRCAGLGTKTFQIVEAAGETGQVIAIDPSAHRLRALRQLAGQRGIESVTIYQSSMLRDISSLAPDSFDRALIDAPCSNSGVIARRPEARYAQDSRSIESVVALQRQILSDTAAYVKPGGLLVYSTCSIWTEENERQVEWFVREYAEYSVQAGAMRLPATDGVPEQYHDGGFVAVLRRAPAMVEPAPPPQPMTGA